MGMTPPIAAAFLALAASAALALSVGTDDPEPRRIAPGGHWWISDGACTITGYFGSPEAEVTSLSIEPTREGTYRLDIANNRWRDMPLDVSLRAGVGFDGGTSVPAGEAFGFSDADGQLFRFWVEPALIDRFADHRELEVYRDGDLLTAVELGGSAEAIAAMNACYAALEESDRLANLAMDDMAMDPAAVEAAADAMEAAANEVEAGVSEQAPDRR